MDLTKIVLKSVNTNKAKDFISGLENLPKETIQGDFLIIDAYWDIIDESISLHVVGTKDELKKIRFNAPKNSKIIKKSKYKLRFNYNGQNYQLKKEFEGTCYP